MEQVFFRLHVRCVNMVTSSVSDRARKMMEYILLSVALVLSILLVWLHSEYVGPRDGGCLRGLVPPDLNASHVEFQILQIDLLPPEEPRFFLQTATECVGKMGVALCAVTASAWTNIYDHASTSRATAEEPMDSIVPVTDKQKLKWLFGKTWPFRKSNDLQRVAPSSGSGTDGEHECANSKGRSDSTGGGCAPLPPVPSSSSAQQTSQHQRTSKRTSSDKLWKDGESESATAALTHDFLPDNSFLFSNEKGWLLLGKDALHRHGIKVRSVTVPDGSMCLGPTLLRWLLHHIVGQDTLVMNWLVALFGGRGYVYASGSREVYNLSQGSQFMNNAHMEYGKLVALKFGVLCTSTFLFFITTTLVSFTLRETQERMLKFTFLLQHHVRHRLSYVALIVTHLVESLVYVPIMVGILFFLFEFFSDQLLAFMVLSLVWICEVYSVISVRTMLSIRFFPRIFFLYLTLFHVYFFSFPMGFSHLALLTTFCLLLHAMLYFWNRFEVPALRCGDITMLRPRQADIPVSGAGSITSHSDPRNLRQQTRVVFQPTNTSSEPTASPVIPPGQGSSARGDG